MQLGSDSVAVNCILVFVLCQSESVVSDFTVNPKDYTTQTEPG